MCKEVETAAKMLGLKGSEIVPFKGLSRGALGWRLWAMVLAEVQKPPAVVDAIEDPVHRVASAVTIPADPMKRDAATVNVLA